MFADGSAYGFDEKKYTFEKKYNPVRTVFKIQPFYEHPNLPTTIIVDMMSIPQRLFRVFQDDIITCDDVKAVM
jgi:hypothetical protein